MSKDRVLRIDTDIEHVGRQKVIDYITKKYGEESVCRIVTFGTLAAKMVLKDVARVLGYPPSWANSLAKMVPDEVKMTLDKALDMNPELKSRYQSDPDVAKVINIAKKLEGNKRHASLHACGLVLAPGAVSDFLPTSMEKDRETGERSLASQVVMTEVEELSLIKMDLLGLKNLTAIHEVIDTIKKTRGIDTVYQDIPLDDRETYQMLANGLTGGVFQLEGQGMTNDVIKPMLADVGTLPDDRMHECFERLIAAVALYRPGPMDFIPNYIDGMRDVSKIHYLTPELEGILKSTYGVIVYQEQVIQIVQRLAGFSAGRADVVRKAMGKKKRKVMDAEKEVFLYGNKDAFDAGKDKNYAPGCIANGTPEPIAQEIWSQMDKFASYAFNRSHAACYAWIASITAYMSCHWTPEFYCAMMNAFEGINDKVRSYMVQAVRRGIKILPPDINKSLDKCVVDNGCIRLGFRSLTGLNKFSRLIVRERVANGPFTDFQSFYDRMTDMGKKPGKGVLESLIFSGTLDCFGLTRSQMESAIPLLVENYKRTFNDRVLDQISMFSPEEVGVLIPEVPEYDEKILMKKEKDAIGFYLTKHPVDKLVSSNNDPSCVSITDLMSAASDESTDFSTMSGEQIWASAYAIIKDIKPIYTKKGDEMFLLSAEDRFSTMPCVLFPSRVPANKHRLEEEAVVKLAGYFSVDEQRGPQFIIQDILDASEARVANMDSVTIEIHDRAEQDKLMEFISKYPGKAAVNLFAKGKTYRTNKKIKLTPVVLDFLKTNFALAETV